MNSPDRKFYSSSASNQATRSFSPWRKGCLFGLILTGFLFALDAIGREGCAIDSISAMNYLSLDVGGFSIFIKWNSAICR